MQCIQYDLFESIDDKSEALKKANEAFEEAKQAREMANKVRRGLFARHNEIAKMYMELNQRLDLLERNICSGK